MLEILAKFIDADKLGGWVRGGLAALFTFLLLKFPGLTPFLSDAVRDAVSVLAVTVVVGLWSQLTKTDYAKVQMAADVPSTKRIESTDPVIANMPAPEVQLAR
jgi:hypothetical protein